MKSISYSNPSFSYTRLINNDYDFEIACETLRNNIQNKITRNIPKVK